MFKSILFTVFSLFCVYASFNDAKPISSLHRLNNNNNNNNIIHAETISNALTEMGTTIDSMKQIHSAFISLADDVTTISTCSSLASDAATKISTDCGAVFSAGPLDINSFLSNGLVASACDGPLKSEAIIKCSTTFNTSYSAAINACGSSNASDVSVAIISKLQGNVQIFANLTALVTLGKAICTKSDDGNSYCIDNLFASGIKDAFADPTKINNTLSKQFCSSCAKQLANTLSGIDQFKRLTDGLTFLCTIDPTNSTNYCMDSVKILVSLNVKDLNASIAALTDADLKQLCSPCTISVLNSFDLIKDNLKQFNIDTTQFKEYIPKLKSVCIRDPQNGNDYCPARMKDKEKGLEKWAATQFNDQQVLASLLTKCQSLLGGQCSAECGAAITQLLAGYGCCLGTLTKAQLAAYVPADQAATFGLALSACVFDLPKACDASKNINLPVTFVLDNLRFEWATAASTNAKFITAFTADLATTFSLDASSIIIKSISPTIKGGVRVVVQFSIDSNVVEGYKATIKARINAAAGLSFGQTSTASNTPSDTNNPSSTGKINQAQGLQADPSTSDVGNASGAMTIKASIATIILSIVSFIAIKLF